MSKIYNTLTGFVETEKSIQRLQPQNKFVFTVRPDVTKIDIKASVKALYNVDVLSVNIIPVRQKLRIVWKWKHLTKRHSNVKAIVTIKEWQKIDFTDIKDQK